MSTTDPQASDAFDAIVGDLDSPMYVVTAFADGERSGCLVGFTTQVSISPRRFLVMMSKTNHTFGVARSAVVLVVHLLREGDEELATRFGELTGDRVDEFEGLVVLDGPGSAPVIEGLDWFAGRVLQQVDLGDHVGFVLAPHDGVTLRGDRAPIGSQGEQGMEPGHQA